MSRVIKFRAWDDGRMYYESFCEYLSGYGCMFNQFTKPDSIMQFTGLHDKNGKEIYEGDIVEFEGLGNYLVDIGGYFSENSVGYGVCYLPNGDDSEFVKDADPMAVERKGSVIGNIQENPELLEV